MADMYTSNMLNQTEFEKFICEGMTVAEDRAFRVLVDKRTESIIKTIFSKCGYSVENYSYDNQTEFEENFFDVSLFNDTVDFYIHDFNIKKYVFFEFFIYSESFPTYWYYSNFEKDLEQAIKNSIDKQAELEIEKKQKEETENRILIELQEAKNKVMELIPPELLKYISFVSIDQLQFNINKIQKEDRNKISKISKELKEKGMDVSTLYKKYKEKGGDISFKEWIKTIR